MEEDDLEISDQEAPDVEQVKKNRRKQAEKKTRGKKQKTLAVEQDLQVTAPASKKAPTAVEMANLNKNVQEPQQQMQRPGLGGDDAAAPESDGEDDSAVLD